MGENKNSQWTNGDLKCKEENQKKYQERKFSTGQE